MGAQLWLPPELLWLVYQHVWQHRNLQVCEAVRSLVQHSEAPAAWTSLPTYRLRHINGRWHRHVTNSSMDYHCLDWGLWHASKVPRSHSIRYICLNTQMEKPVYRVYRHCKRYVFGWEISRKGINHYKPGPECCDKQQWRKRKRHLLRVQPQVET